MNMPTEFVPVGGEKEYAVSGQYRKPSMQPVGFMPKQTTVTMSKSPEEIQQDRTKLLMALEGAKAGLPAGIRTENVASIFRPSGKSLEQLEAEQAIKNKGKVTGLVTWQGYDSKTGERIPTMIKRTRQPPLNTDKVVWDVYGGKDKRLNSEALRQARDIQSQMNIQKLVTNYLDDPIEENKTQMIEAYKTQGKTVIFPETNAGQRLLRWAGISEIPVFIVKDKSGKYSQIDIDASGEMIEIPMKKSNEKIIRKTINGKTYIKQNGTWYEE